MGQVTGIEWCDHTYNSWIGCTKVSPACDHCYAEAQEDARYGRVSRAAHVGAPAKPHAALHTIGIDKQRRPANGGVSSACHWAISGTTKYPMSGAQRR
jgi:protein gp37